MKIGELFRQSPNTESFKAGDFVFRRGDQGELMYVVKSGAVEIRINDTTLEQVDADGVFGEMALIDDEPRSADVVAIADTELVPVDARRFQFLVQQTPFFAVEVMRILADRIRRTDAMLHESS